jgi:hypothetical protein
MIRLLIIAFILLTIGMFILSKIKPDLFHRVKEHSILHTLILIGLSVVSAVSFFSGTYLSVIAKVQLTDIFRYYSVEGSLGSISMFLLVGIFFLLPWGLALKYILSFKYLARYIVKKLNLELIMDIYDFE